MSIHVNFVIATSLINPAAKKVGGYGRLISGTPTASNTALGFRWEPAFVLKQCTLPQRPPLQMVACVICQKSAIESEETRMDCLHQCGRWMHMHCAVAEGYIRRTGGKQVPPMCGKTECLGKEGQGSESSSSSDSSSSEEEDKEKADADGGGRMTDTERDAMLKSIYKSQQKFAEPTHDRAKEAAKHSATAAREAGAARRCIESMYAKDINQMIKNFTDQRSSKANRLEDLLEVLRITHPEKYAVVATEFNGTLRTEKQLKGLKAQIERKVRESLKKGASKGLWYYVGGYIVSRSTEMKQDAVPDEVWAAHQKEKGKGKGKGKDKGPAADAAPAPGPVPVPAAVPAPAELLLLHDARSSACSSARSSACLQCPLHAPAVAVRRCQRQPLWLPH